MPRKFVCVSLVVAALAAVSFDAHAGGDPSPLVPPNSHAYGKSFEEWNVLYARWFVETNLGGQMPSDTVGHVRLLPARSTPGTYEFNVTLKPGTPFVAPPFPTFGEAYNNGTPDDDPDDPFIVMVEALTHVRVVLDGRTLMDDTAADLAKYHYGPVYFDPPIPYAEPTDYDSTSAIWTEGIGAVYQPLPVGRHTLVNTAEGFLGKYQHTYHITVSPH
jgi:hypothetical protein